MLKKLCTLFISAGLIFGLTACSKTETKENNTDTKDNNVEETSVDIKTVDDFQESQGLIKYFTIEDKNFSIPETVGEYANYLSQIGTVTLNDTGNSVEEEEIDANGISSMVAYLNVETEDGDVQRFYVRYENTSDDAIPVAQAKITQIEVKYDPLSEFKYEKAFDSITVVTENYTFEMDGKEDIDSFFDELGNPEHVTDGRLDYSDSLGYKYTFDCCNENRKGIFRGFIIKYPQPTE
ncbi:hypothetical protein [Thomasclavelia spiroformis]|uniref:hypothetical protein n=1 Tax=Thomasclavelia spiroformis TaxID=29348 RepID=UPI000B392DCF|nr:hypothetical protein [Thomasclavelia spiroformis]OUQ02159.1 hypothetical protein B5E98_06925 [Thomasclavelia spiroformis]